MTNREKLLVVFVTLTEELGRVPTNAELNKRDITRSAWREEFGTFDDYDTAARVFKPDAFADIRLEDIRTEKIQKAKRYVITTAVAGAPVNQAFLDTLKNYCRVRKAKLIILACEDPASRYGRQGYISVDRALEGTIVVGSDWNLNSRLVVRTFKTSAKQIDPTTGTLRFGPRGSSSIFASPKQRLRFAPTGGTFPHAVMTTGAVTNPAYTTDLYWSLRTAYLAEMDHVLGALVVNIVNDETFHFRQLQFDDKSRSVIDCGWRYRVEGAPDFERAEAVVFGDLHCGQETIKHYNARQNILNELQPKRIVLHDVFDARTISHHDKGKHLTRGAKAHTNLDTELCSVELELQALAVESEVYVVKSNHDEALDKYLDECRFRFDPNNIELGLELALAKVRGEDPLRYFCKNVDNVTFIPRDGNLEIEGIECGKHGDRGANGSRGSTQAMENGYGASVSGHSHTGEILRGAWKVGTSTKLQLDYNTGEPSSWTNTHCVIYKGGQRQLLNVINGRWK
jgi:hypothetical protein